MLRRICSVIVLVLAGAVMWSCGSEPVMMPEVAESDLSVRGQGPLSKPAVSRDVTKAVVVASVHQDGVPVRGATVELSRSISGRAADYAWSGTTDESGQASVAIGADNVSGYYQARAMQDGSMLGSWSSIPINGGYASVVDLPVGGKARVVGSSILPPEPEEPEAPESLALGMVLPLTGPNAEPYGLPMRDGFELALEEINSLPQLGGTSIRFITEDSRSSVEGAVEAFNKLIHEDGVPVIFGPAISTYAEQAFPIAQENQVVAFSSISSAAGLSAIGDFIFRAGLTVDVLVPGGVKITHEKLGYQKVAVIYDTLDTYSRSGYEAMVQAFADNEVEVLAAETFETDETDFSEQLNRIKALNPEAIFVSSLSTEMKLILVEARKLEIPTDIPFIVPDLAIGEVKAVGDAAEGAIAFSGWTSMADTPGNQVFIERYKATYGVEPSPWAAQSYAALYILARAIFNAGSMEATAIRDAMAEIRDLDTILGSFSFNADGDAVYEATVLIVRNGRFEVFE